MDIKDIRLERDAFELLQEAENEGKSWKVLLIEAGLSKNGKFYPAEVLKKAAPLFEKAKAFFYQFKGKHFDHVPVTVENLRPEGFPRQIAGWYSNVKFEEVAVDGEKKKGLTAILHIHDGAKWLREMLSDAWKHGMKRILGLSIDAEGSPVTKFIDGKSLEVISSINRVFGIDLVTHPAAGGQLLRLLASEIKGGKPMDWVIELMKKLRPDLLEGVNIEEIKETEMKEILEKALQDADETQKKAIEEAKKKIAEEEKKKKDEEEKKKKEEEEKKKKEEEEKKKKEAEAAKKAKEADEKAYEEAIKALDKETKELLESDMKAIEENEKFQEADGKATLDQAIKLIKAKKYALALNVLQKWLSKYPAPENKDKGYPAKEVKALEKQIQDINLKAELAECAEILDAELKNSKLPEPVRAKVEKGFKGKKFEKKALDEAIKLERDTLAKLTESGDVDLGDLDSDITMGRSGEERIQAALDLMVDPKIEDSEKEKYENILGFTSLREAYVKITGDVEISGRISRQRLQEATTSDFTYALGTSMTRRMVRDYKLTPALWKDLADIVPVKDFKQQEIIRWGGFADLETVSESTSTDYPDITVSQDDEATYTAATRGGLVTITRRMIINDDLRMLRKIPQKMARAAVRTLNRFTFDLMLSCDANHAINVGTIYDGLTLYNTSGKHFNYTTDALDYDALSDMIDRLREQKELGYKIASNAQTAADATSVSVAAGGTNIKVGDYLMCEAEFIGPVSAASATSIDILSTSQRGIWGSTAAIHASGKYWYVVTDDLMLEPGLLWVPTDLRALAQSLETSEYQDDTLSNKNMLRGSFKTRAVPRNYLRGDVNNYYLTAKKGDIEMIEIGFVGGRETPELLVQDAPGVGLVFTRDNIRYKVRHEYGGAVIDYRGFQGAIVA